jgi:hypothetical protein
MFHQPSCDTPHLYRALVTFADEHTGEIRVKIPSLTGIESEASLSYIGRSSRNSFWVVPEVNSQILVTADDPNFSNIFWVRTDETKNRNYAFSAYNTSTLTASAAGLLQHIHYTTTTVTEGISLVDDSKITFAHTGTYNVQFSVQVENSATSTAHDFAIWIRKNGTNVDNSNSYVTIPVKKSGVNGRGIIAVNFVDTYYYGDYIELWWTVDSTSAFIASITPTGSFANTPVSPGVIVTVTQVA